MLEPLNSMDLASSYTGEAQAGIDPGWGWLRRRIGNIPGGSLFVIGGRDGLGKSFLCLHILHEMAKAGTRVAYFSCEDTQGEVARRLKLGLAHPLLDCYFPTNASLVEITSAMEASRRVSAVDYVQVVSLDNGESSFGREDEVARIVRALKSQARALDLPVLLASQVGRPALGEDPYTVPSKHRLAESSRIEKSAEYILLMGPEADGQHVVVELAKAKNAPIGHRVRLRRGAGGRLEPAARVVEDDDGDDDCSAVR